MVYRKQYDVFIEKDVSNDDKSLVAIQFPAMKSQFDNDPDRIHVSLKPKSMKLKLEVETECDSDKYCKEKAESLARISKPQQFPSKMVDRNIYTSTRNIIDDSQIFVCKTINNRLVCRPINHFLTMRSDLTHFDLKDEVDPKEEVKPISVKFAATNRESAPIKKNHDSAEELEACEEYQVFEFLPPDSQEAILAKTNLFGLETKIKPDPDAEHVDIKPNIITDDTPMEDVKPDIKPKIEKMEVDDVYSSSSNEPGPHSSVIRARVKECLTKAKIVSIEEVYRFLKNYRDYNRGRAGANENIQITTKDIMDALNEYALLVQGNWAIKSEVYYGDSGDRECTDVTGIPINLFTAARDYLLWLFNQNRLVSRLEFTKQVKIPDHDVLELFNQLAVFRRDIKKWELKLPTDQRFLDQFPDIVQRQATFWKVRRANKLSLFQ